MAAALANVLVRCCEPQAATKSAIRTGSSALTLWAAPISHRVRRQELATITL